MISRSCFYQITLKVMRRATSRALHRMLSTTLLLTTGLQEPTPQSCRASMSATGRENKEVFAYFSLAPCFLHLSVVIYTFKGGRLNVKIENLNILRAIFDGFWGRDTPLPEGSMTDSKPLTYFRGTCVFHGLGIFQG